MEAACDSTETDKEPQSCVRATDLLWALEEEPCASRTCTCTAAC